jgi:predicted phosphate transport protein (TIGR00153 family)
MKAWLSGVRERLAHPFRRKPNHFIERLREQSLIVVQGTEALIDYMSKPNKKNSARVRSLEKEADEVRRILIDELNRTFVTPIDREDLFALSRAIDDVLDYAFSTTNEMDILNVSPNDYLRSMSELLHNSAEEISLAIERLERHPNVAGDHAVRIKGIENRMETLYAEALAHLFDEPKDLKDVIAMFKLREIYRHMFHAVGSAEQAANIIGDIVIKFF